MPRACVSVHFLDLGPADALFDPERQWLALSPRLSPVRRRRAARRMLADAGIRQSRVGCVVSCHCGRELRVDPITETMAHGRRHVALATKCLLAAIAGAATFLYAAPGVALVDASTPGTHVDRVVPQDEWARDHNTFCNRRRGLCYDTHDRHD